CLIRTLDYDAGADALLAAELRKITGLGSRNQLVAQFEGALARQHRPNGKNAVSIEMVVRYQFYSLSQHVPVGGSHKVQSNFRRGIGFDFGGSLVAFPVREVNAVRNCAID